MAHSSFFFPWLFYVGILLISDVFVSVVQTPDSVMHRCLFYLGSFSCIGDYSVFISFPMLFSNYFLIIYLINICVYVNSKLLISPTWFWRLGALQRATGSPGSLWGHIARHMLPAPSAPGHSSLPTQANQAPGMWYQPRSLWPEGNRISISFSVFFCFYPIIYIAVNYSLVGFVVYVLFFILFNVLHLDFLGDQKFLF